ncbi:copper resistance protein CopC [Bacillus sp. JCM 19046]|nr:copper resistance protein CopC [Bacillus sp. JCM 19046]
MRKKISLLMILSIALLVPQQVFAHSHYEASTPGENEVVNEPVNEVTVTFDGGIAAGDMTITNEETNEEASISSIEVEATSILAILEDELENGSYLVEWENIGDDTHVIEGSFTFEVNAPEEVTPEDEQAAEEDAANNAENEMTEDEQADTASETEETESGSAVLWISLGLVALFIIGLIAFAVSRRKK